jgi:hypothetical protein
LPFQPRGLHLLCTVYLNFGTPTKHQVSKRQVSKRLISKSPVSKRQVYKTSDLQNVRFQNVWFQNVQFLNFIYLLTKSIGIAKLALLFKVKSVSLLLIIVIYGKKTSKIENKTQPLLCLPTWLQQNLRISTNHNYRIYMDFFVTGRFEDLTFCKPDIL